MKVSLRILLLAALLPLQNAAFANLPGGGTGTGANVTLVDNGTTVTLANGIISIVITKASATIHTLNYTYNNSGSAVSPQLLNGGTDGGMLYWELGGFSSGTFTYTNTVNPMSSGGNYGEVDLFSTSATNGTVDIHFSMLRGSTGFYVTAIWSHRAGDSAIGLGETRDNIYAGSIFNWMSVDAARNRLMEVSGGTAIGVLNAPVEVSLWISGLYQGQYEDKYSYSADFGEQRVWGWSSVGSSGANVGLWNVSASVEYYNGGPMKRELMSHIGTTILNMHNGGHYGGGSDGSWATGEIWNKVYGPYFIYCNNITNSLKDETQASAALYADALAQAAAEQTAWPYAWFTNANYAAASGRGAVTGAIVIADAFNPNASAANLWVGVVEQPSTTDGVFDFQEWMKPYQFWVKTDSNGNFTIPNVIAGAGYTLYAFGPGAAGTFQSQAQSGGSPPNSINIPSPAFSVTVSGGATNNLGNVTWTPTRVGPTVFEIGYPNRTGDKFRHGDDYWKGDVGPNATSPSPIWSKHLAYPIEFPNGPNYTVGQSRWSMDWDYVQPVVTDNQGNFNGSTSTITFTLGAAPANGAQASLYLALSSDYQGALVIQVNGTNIAGSTGYFPAYSSSDDESDTTIRQGIHGCFSDNRITFAGNMLRQGLNTITINMRKGGYFANHAMYDYLRLELTGYVPPAPGNVAAYAGNNCNLICWPVTPGATSYNLLSSTNSGSGYALLATNLAGPVCGSGTNNAVYLDTNAVNDTTYYYVVQSVNPVGASVNSPQSSGATPDASVSMATPATPAGLIPTPGNARVTLNWNASPGANFYTVQRSTVVNNGVGSYVTLSTITLNNTNTSTTFTDTTPYNGSTYNYFVSATGAGGTSGNSSAAMATPLPPAPAGTPAALTGSFTQTTNITLNWSALSGAVGYVIKRATSSSGPFTLIASITETTYTDFGLNANGTYYYQVSAVNAAGVSGNAAVTVSGAPAAPASLSAIAGNTQILLVWPASTGAATYTVTRGLASGNETTTVAIGYSGTSYTNINLVNGTTYYYVVTASGTGGTSGNSPEASATPSSAAAAGLVWTGANGTNWDTTSTNWLNGLAASTYADGNNVTFNNSGVTGTVAVASAVFPSSVTFNNSSVNYTFSGAGGISGNASITKSNTGTVTFSGANSYSGGLTISGGLVTLPAANGSTAFTAALGSSTVTLNNGGELLFAPPGGSAGKTSSTFTNNFVLNGGILYADDGQEHLTGTITVNATTTLLRQWNNSSSDKVKAVLLDGVLSGSGALNLYGTGGNANQGARIWIDNASNTYGGTISVYPGTAFTGFSAASGGFSLGIGANNALQFATVNLQGTQTAGGTDTSELYGVQFLGGVIAPVLGALAGNGKINLDTFATVAAVALTVGGNNSNSVFSGVLLNTTGNGSLTKTGTGTMTLSGANTYTGGTTVNGGTLLVNNASGSGTGVGPVIVTNGGTLGGVGFISGPVTVNDDSTLAPGNPLGTLTLSSTLALSQYGITLIQVNPSPHTNSILKLTGPLTQNGTLTVTNISTNAFSAGDHFTLFSALGYNGAFDDFELPDPGAPGLAWDTTRINVDGTLWMISTIPPNLAASNFVSVVTGNNLILSGTGGTPNWYYYVLGSTDPTLPPAQWTRLATNHFDSNGNFAYTNAIDPSLPQTFLMLEIP